MSIKLLISPSNLNESLAGWSALVAGLFIYLFFPLHLFKYIIALPYGLQFLQERKSADNHTEIPLCFTFGFNIFSLYLIFVSVINM